MGVDPSALKIVFYPDPALRVPGRPVAPVTDAVRGVARRMIELMREAEGIGLAAPQVGLPWRLFVVDVPPGEDRSADTDPASATHGPLVCVNPVVSDSRGPVEPGEEGCLSIPEIRGDVIRPAVVRVTARDLDDREFSLTAGGLLARCIQHEVDHLDGVLIIDRMTQMSRLKNRAAVRAMERDAEPKKR